MIEIEFNIKSDRCRVKDAYTAGASSLHRRVVTCTQMLLLVVKFHLLLRKGMAVCSGKG